MLQKLRQLIDEAENMPKKSLKKLIPVMMMTSLLLISNSIQAEEKTTKPKYKTAPQLILDDYKIIASGYANHNNCEGMLILEKEKDIQRCCLGKMWKYLGDDEKIVQKESFCEKLK